MQVVQEAPPGQRAALVGFVAAAVRKTLKPHMAGPALATLTLLLTGVLKGAVLTPQQCHCVTVIVSMKRDVYPQAIIPPCKQSSQAPCDDSM